MGKFLLCNTGGVILIIIWLKEFAVDRPDINH